LAFWNVHSFLSDNDAKFDFMVERCAATWNLNSIPYYKNT